MGITASSWVHLLRALHELKHDHPQDSEVMTWAQAVRACYDDAQAWLAAERQAALEARAAQYVVLTSRTHALGVQYAKAYHHPCCALAKRLLRHQDELFQFVLIEGLSADNNLAERSIRPLVVIRKISGGSRSTEGTKTRMGLASLFETWQARTLNPFAECFKQLSQPTTSPS
jgi:transposase